MSALTSSARTVGLRMASDPCVVHFFRRRDNLKDVFKSMRHEQPDLGLIVVVLDKKGDYGPGYSK